MANDPFVELERLWALKEAGALSEAEFQRLKDNALNSSSAEPPPSSAPQNVDRSNAAIPAPVPARSSLFQARKGCGIAVALSSLLLVAISQCSPNEQASSNIQDTAAANSRTTPSSENDGESDRSNPAAASRAGFEARSLSWPLTVPNGTLGCTAMARWVAVSGTKYGLNGMARERDGYAPLEKIWAIDEKMMSDLKAVGGSDGPVVRISVGDMIEEAGKLC